MKHYNKLLTIAAFCAVALTACKKQAYYQVDPNSPSVATPSLLLTNILVSTFNTGPETPAYASRQIVDYDGIHTYVNYGWTRGSFGDYDVLRQVKDMDSAAAKSGELNYRALAKFFRALYYIDLTETFGDVPYSNALKAVQGVTQPKYDAQKDVYIGCLADLEDANNMLDKANGPIAGDIIYGTDADPVKQWKQLVNAFRLRVLIHLSKKESDADLNIKQQFQNIVSNPSKYPLMTSISDNGQIVFNTSDASNYYPTYLSNDMQTATSMEKGFVNLMKDRNDPRLFEIAEPIANQPAGVVTSYAGVDAGLSVADQQTTSGQASRLKKRYWNSQVNEPHIILGYAEQEFLIAEAIARNWVTGAGTAASHYNNGVTASMQFYGIGADDITTYLAQPNVAYNAGNAIPLIITQKYLSFFMNSGWEPFFEQRRTGIPTFDVGDGTLNGGVVPKRWMYPNGELTNNPDNLAAALQNQYGGNDDINAVMWLLK